MEPWDELQPKIPSILAEIKVPGPWRFVEDEYKDVVRSSSGKYLVFWLTFESGHRRLIVSGSLKRETDELCVDGFTDYPPDS